jgi:hypothetical protein
MRDRTQAEDVLQKSKREGKAKMSVIEFEMSVGDGRSGITLQFTKKS